ncbi:MAG: TerB family tellurite resistance protein [Deltaproteobacteria bacterium]|nr:TerB family tellurite resistance protein [Deltaproteobacteria bacterium]
MERRLGRDVFIALAAVGWADGKLHGDEANAIVRMAVEEGLAAEEIADIEEATKRPVTVGTIDTTKMTDVDRVFVYAVGAWIARVDREIAPEEITALNRLAAALDLPDEPREHGDRIAIEVGKSGFCNKPGFYNLRALREKLHERLSEVPDSRKLGGEG